MKKTEQKALGTQEEKGRGSNLARWCVGVAAAANAACPAVQVRPEPPPEACPAGAEEVMTTRFKIDRRSPTVTLPGAKLGPPRIELLPVQEGPIFVELLDNWSEMPEGTVLSGRLVFGPERVYGRFTEAHLPSKETVPVCFALRYGSSGPLGLAIEGTVGPGIVKVWPVADLVPVDRFE